MKFFDLPMKRIESFLKIDNCETRFAIPHIGQEIRGASAETA